jgi:hypothetical protein
MPYIGAGIQRFNTADELTVTGDAQIDTTTLVVDSTNNRVGIGTASPATALDVTGTVTADGLDLGTTTDDSTVSSTASDYQLQLGSAQSTTGDIGRNISFGFSGTTTAAINTIDGGTGTNQSLGFFTHNNTSLSERMRITSGGNVGIGLTAPEQLLHLRNASGNCVAVLGQFGTGTKASLTAAANQVDLKADNGTNDFITFTTGSSERLRLKSDGDVSIADGNLILASGHGIDFSATADGSGTTSSELLDDYEEGTWTPVVGHGDDGTATYSTQQGKYTKVGRWVAAEFDITINSIGTGNDAQMSGLPFSMGNHGGVMSGYVSFYSGLKTSVFSLDCYVISNTSNILFTGHNTQSTGVYNSVPVFQDSTRVLGTIHYFV